MVVVLFVVGLIVQAEEATAAAVVGVFGFEVEIVASAVVVWAAGEWVAAPAVETQLRSGVALEYPAVVMVD